MIGSIKGKVILKKDKFIIVNNNNLGYKINISLDTLEKIKIADEIFLYTHLHVREDILDLYGFLEYAELEFFEMLISISGIGPRGALGILNIAPVETLKKAISMGDTSYLTKISGIGKKTAEKVVLELKDKIGLQKNDGSFAEELDILEALRSLGYSQNEAREALKKTSATASTNTKIKEALKILGNK